MSIAILTSLYEGSPDANPFTSSQIDTSGATCLIAMLVAGNGSLTLSDSESNTYGTPDISDTQGSIQYKIWVIFSPTTSATHDWITGGSAFGPGLMVLLLSGTALSGPVTQSITNHATGVSSLQPGSITPSVANTIIVTWETGTDLAASIDAPFDFDGHLSITGTHFGGTLAFEIQAPGPTARNPTWTVGFSSNQLVGQMVIPPPTATAGHPNSYYSQLRRQAS